MQKKKWPFQAFLNVLLCGFCRFCEQPLVETLGTAVCSTSASASYFKTCSEPNSRCFYPFLKYALLCKISIFLRQLKAFIVKIMPAGLQGYISVSECCIFCRRNPKLAQTWLIRAPWTAESRICINFQTSVNKDYVSPNPFIRSEAASGGVLHLLLALYSLKESKLLPLGPCSCRLHLIWGF